MKDHFINETASTSGQLEPKAEATVETNTSSEGIFSGAKPGRLLASLVLWAALTTAGPVGTAPLYLDVKRREETAAESSTADVERDPELARQVQSIFDQGASEFFQDGMYSNFSRSLLTLLAQHGRAAFRAIAEYVFSGNGNADVISEALRWLADFDDPATLPQRWAILQRTLQDRSPRIRDGAILGFAALDDPRARSILLDSQKSESVPELQRLIQQVIDQLNATDAAAAAQR